MKLILSIVGSLVCFFVQAQSTSQPATNNSNTSVSPKVNTGNLKLQLQQDPANANAWFNYYNSLGRDKTISVFEKQQQQEEALFSSRQYINGTWQYSMMLFLGSGKKDSSALFNALEASDDKAIIYPYVAQFAIIKNDQQLLKKYCTAINSNTPITKSMYEYHYNTLMSAEHGAIIYAKGLSDLVPLAIMQQVYGIRQDLLLKYYENKVNDTNAYLCISLGKEILAQYPNGVYTGLLVKVSQRQNKSRQLKDNFLYDQLDNATSLTDEEKLVYRNYLPSMIILYKSYLEKNDPAADKCKQRIDHIASLTGTTAMVNNLLAR